MSRLSNTPARTSAQPTTTDQYLDEVLASVGEDSRTLTRCETNIDSYLADRDPDDARITSEAMSIIGDCRGMLDTVERNYRALADFLGVQVGEVRP